jgi:hypothetical protein
MANGQANLTRIMENSRRVKVEKEQEKLISFVVN